jgi:ribosome maturation factor RimP
LDQIRAIAERVATSHHLEVVEVEFSGAGKFRALRVFVEKDAAGRAKLAELAAAQAEMTPDEAEAAGIAYLPKGVPVEALSGVTHEDCATFAQDFGTVLDVEDLIPGTTEYTLEVSSPGLERKLFKAVDYARFVGSLVALQAFAPVNGAKKFVGRMSFENDVVTLDLSAVKQAKGKKKSASAAAETVSIPLKDVEKAQLVAEI